jgi:pantoate--beta-alanine ligase
MRLIRTREEMRQYIEEARTAGQTIGFVPTMGFLHDGHKSLLHRARKENDIVVLSIFVNPLQFGPNEDFDRYPRDEDHDLHVARTSDVDVVFLPPVEEMYPDQIQLAVRVGSIAETLCGKSRPGHFDGVATVVYQLFQLVQPTRAYFGMKDAQQVAVLTSMCQDLNLPVEIVPCPIIREKDGLAMSSRNVYLSEDERRQALAISEALSIVARMVDEEPHVKIAHILHVVKETIESHTLAKIDYVELLTYPRLKEIDPLKTIAAARDEEDTLLLAVAVKYGKTRLIDNIRIQKGGELTHV